MKALHQDSEREIDDNIEQHYELPSNHNEGNGEENGDLA